VETFDAALRENSLAGVFDATQSKSNLSPACEEGAELLRAWRDASRPCLIVELEYLVLYEENKQQTRSALIGHYKVCAQCRGARKGGLLRRLVRSFKARFDFAKEAL